MITPRHIALLVSWSIATATLVAPRAVHAQHASTSIHWRLEGPPSTSSSMAHRGTFRIWIVAHNRSSRSLRHALTSADRYG